MEQEWTQPLSLRVRHLTRYHYHDQVWDSFNEARLQPCTDSAQECRVFLLNITPEAVSRDYPDFHGNCVHYFDVTQPHHDLSVEAISLVQTRHDERGPVPQINPPSSLGRDNSIIEDYFDFLNSSDYVSLEAEVWREALDALPNGVNDLWLDSVTIGQHIYKNFTYTPATTTVNTKPKDVVLTRRGVCQDFAHLMLGMCRTHGIPARYASGYFYNHLRNPDDIEASHAWVEVFLPGYGWKGFDPTHNRVPDTRYVKLAVGRDYGDIRPLSGSFRGKGMRQMIVEVQITREDS
jgi:transglutaminase-like putative cysteine protease